MVHNWLAHELVYSNTRCLPNCPKCKRALRALVWEIAFQPHVRIRDQQHQCLRCHHRRNPLSTKICHGRQHLLSRKIDIAMPSSMRLMASTDSETPVDVVVVGGGPAGTMLVMASLTPKFEIASSVSQLSMQHCYSEVRGHIPIL